MSRLLYTAVPFVILVFASLRVSFSLVAVSPYFSDGVVLQTNYKSGFRSYIYGTASPSEKVTISGSIPGCPYTTSTDSNGTWIIQFNPDHVFGTKYSISISGDSNATHKIDIANITFGDVYLCLGSENMAFPMKSLDNATKELTDANKYKTISIISIPTINAIKPQILLNDTTSNSNNNNIKWQVANASTLESFSSICYLSGQKMYDIYAQNGMSIGLVQVTVPQSTLNCWMSQTAIEEANSVCKDTENSYKNDNKNSNILRKNAYGGARAHSSTGAVCDDSSLFNGMINPLVYQTYRAVIFSSGENEISTVNYGCKAGLMFNNMRDLYSSGDFAVAVIQASSVKSNSTANGIDFGYLRNEELQLLPGYNDTIYITGLVMTYDLGNRTNATSKYKQEVARRTAMKLARIGPVVYTDHNSTLYDGPMIYNAFFSDENGTDTNGILLNFTNLDTQKTMNTLQLLPTKGCKTCCNTDGLFEISYDNVTWSKIDTYSVYSQDTSMILLINPLSKLSNKFSSGSNDWYVRYGFSSFVECAVYRYGSTIPAQGPFVIHVGANPSQMREISETTSSKRRQMRSKTVKNSKTGTNGKKSNIVAATPPMGFNTWEFAWCAMDVRLVKRTALKMIEYGLLDAGYEYFNLDDCWQTDRTYSSVIEEQVIIPDSVRYPLDLFSLGSWLNERGFKFGIYSARKSKTCQYRDGSYMHEEIDVITYCNWNVSYIKLDSCQGEDYKSPNDSWVKFRNAIDHNCSHDIVFSVESCATVSGCGQWVGNLANLWRTTADIQDNWDSILSNADHTEAMYSIAGPGHWNDPDMLEIGNAGLSLDEEVVQFSLWAIMASPLLIATNLVTISQDSLNVLLNTEVIAVNQDPLGMQGHKLVANTSGTEIWYRNLESSNLAVVLLNRDASKTFDISVDLTKLGVSKNVSFVGIRDLWLHEDLGNFTSLTYVAQNVGPHACNMIKVVPYYQQHSPN